MTKQTATQTYQERRAEIDELMTKIQAGLKTFDAEQAENPTHWTYPGSLAHAIDQLKEAAHAIGAISDEELEGPYDDE